MYGKKQQQKKRILTVIVIIIIAALAFAYVIPLTGWAVSAAPETPPPDPPTSWDLDESTLPPPPGTTWGDPEEELPPPTLYITSNSLVLDVGARAQVEFVMQDFPEGVVARWATSNTNVVVVNEFGALLAVGSGVAEVEVRAGEMRSTLFVTVNDVKANRIVISINDDVVRTGPNAYELVVGDVVRLTSKIEPSGAKVDRFSWILGNPNVATISPNGQNCEFVASAVGQTLITVTAGSIEDSISISIVESGVPISALWEYIRFGVIIVVAIVIIAVILTYLNQKKKREEARQKAIAKRRREEAERRAREEADTEMQRELESRSAQTGERSTMKINGAIVGAGIQAQGDEASGPERPLTLDDLD